MDVVYFDSVTDQPVGVRVGGQILPVRGGTEITVSAGDTTVTSVNLTLLLPGLKFEYVASEEAAGFESELSSVRGGAR